MDTDIPEVATPDGKLTGGTWAMPRCMTAFRKKSAAFLADYMTDEKLKATNAQTLHFISTMIMILVNNISFNSLKGTVKTHEVFTAGFYNAGKLIVKSISIAREKLRNMAHQACLDEKIDFDDDTVRAQIHIYGQSVAYAEDLYNQALGAGFGGQHHPDMNFIAAGSGVKGPARVNLCNYGGWKACLGQIYTNCFYSRNWGNPFSSDITFTSNAEDARSSLQININVLSTRIPEKFSSVKGALGGFMDYQASRSQIIELYGNLCQNYQWMPLMDITPLVPPPWVFASINFGGETDCRDGGTIGYVNVAIDQLKTDGSADDDDIIRGCITAMQLPFQDAGVVEAMMAKDNMEGWITKNHTVKGPGKFCSEITDKKGTKQIKPKMIGYAQRIVRAGYQTNLTEYNTMFQLKYHLNQKVDYSQAKAFKPNTKAQTPIMEAMTISQGGGFPTEMETTGGMIDQKGGPLQVRMKGVGLITRNKEIMNAKKVIFEKMREEARARPNLKQRAVVQTIKADLIKNEADFKAPPVKDRKRKTTPQGGQKRQRRQ